MILTQLVNVPDIGSGNTARHRIAGLLSPDCEILVVASALAGEEGAKVELTAPLADLERLALAVFSGERRAVTEPGLARKLSAFALVLSRVCHAANAFQRLEVFTDDDGQAQAAGPDGNRAAAADDADTA